MKTVLRFAKGVVLIAFLAPLAVAAAEQTPSASPNARYIIVLKEPEQMPAGAKEPDVRKHGGREHGRWGTRRSVELPPQAIEALRKDPAVLFITRVNTGNGETPEEIVVSSEGRRMSTEAVAVPPQWDSGDYAYDGSGNIKKIGNDTYVYDDVNRLVKATVNGKVETYQYDSFGNMTEHITDGVQIATPVDKLTNRSIGTSYDVAGNQTTSYGVEQVYRYDGVNMMTQKADYTLATDRFLYTVDDERIGTGRMDEWTWVIRDFNGKPLSEFDSGPFTDWLWLENDYYRDGALASSSRPLAWGGARHFHLDHLGTPRLITNDAREKLAAHDYYPFGREQTLMNQEWVNRNGDRPTTLKFTGHERDFIARNDAADTRYLDYMHARYYNPNMGRFLSVDPNAPWLLQGGSDNDRAKFRNYLRAPQNWNRYAYVNNNPIGRTDPTGRCAEDLCVGEAIVVGVVAAAETPAGQAALEGAEEEAVGLAERFGPQAAEEMRSAFEATQRSLRSIDLGRLGERAMGVFNQVKERIASATGTANFRIPDLLDKVNKVLGDAKNVTRLSMSNQLRDFAAYAQANGYQLVIGVRTGTVLSKPVQAMVDAGLIKIVYMKMEGQ